MKIYLVFLFCLIIGMTSAQDYTLVFDQYMGNGTSWMGSFTEDDYLFDSDTVNYISLVFPESEQAFIGRGKFPINCQPLVDAMDGSNNNGNGIAYLPNGRTLQIINNHTSLSVYIKYVDPVESGFVCVGSGVPDCILAPGGSSTLLAVGNDIDSIEGNCPITVPTLSQWGLIILSLALGCLGTIGVLWKLGYLRSMFAHTEV